MVFVRLFVILVIAIGTYLTLDVAYAGAVDTKIAASPIPTTINKQTVAGDNTTATTTFGPELDQTVSAALAGTSGTYSVCLKDLKTGATYQRNADHTYVSASLYKLWVMAEVYKQIEAGNFTLDTKLSDTVEDLNKKFDIASDSAELTTGSFSMTVSEALEKMITISHNYAALLLTSKIHLASLESFLSANGLNQSHVGSSDPKTTASDIALFYEKLYNGQLANTEDTKAMLGLLARQQINDRIPKYLPSGLTIMHKTGELYGVKHDAGIVESPQGTYIIVLMSDSNNQTAAAEREANLSKDIYNYYLTWAAK